MQVGVFYFPTDYGIAVSELAQAAEIRGFASLYLPERTHIPVSRRSPFPGGGELPKKYSHTHDPFAALSRRRNIQRLLDNYAPLAAAG
jgi:alkanesulfonate monooxygenase SsuD/methylene tetrahydromethanopterin reductase-like flavin-dependent oxidoreductase (luciferase family)